MVIVSLEDARREGLKRYFTGRPCRRGHVSERNTSNKTCLECHKEIQAKVYRKHAPKIGERVSRYKQKNRERVAAWAKARQERLRDDLMIYYSSRYHKKKAEIAEKIRNYRNARPGWANSIKKAYVMRKSKAMPPWANRSAIEKIYRIAGELTKQTGIVHDVDHIYPLKGRNSSGLHVPWNLQILTKTENCRKATKTPDEWARMS